MLERLKGCFVSFYVVICMKWLFSFISEGVKLFNSFDFIFLPSNSALLQEKKMFLGSFLEEIILQDS